MIDPNGFHVAYQIPQHMACAMNQPSIMQSAHWIMNQSGYVPPEVMRLRRAQKIAAEVRARRPEMQVRKVVP